MPLSYGDRYRNNNIGRANLRNKIEGLPFDLYAQFFYNGASLTVEEPRFYMFNVDDPETKIAFSAIGSPPLKTDRTEYEPELLMDSQVYKITINPSSLPVGWYKVVWDGMVSMGSDKARFEVSGKIEIADIDRADRLLLRALYRLADEDLNNYILLGDKFHKFKASSLLYFMEEGLQFINISGATQTHFTIESLPEDLEIILVDYMVAASMFRMARLHIDNDLQISDSKSISQSKFDKYKSLYDTKMAEIEKRIVNYKKINPTTGAGHRIPKVPYYILYRSISLSSRNFFNSSNWFAMNVGYY